MTARASMILVATTNLAMAYYISGVAGALVVFAIIALIRCGIPDNVVDCRL